MMWKAHIKREAYVYFLIPGLMQAIQNLGLALITMLSGYVVDKLGYLWLELFFIFWLAVALLAIVVIWLIDSYGSGYLNMGVGERDTYEAEQKRKAAEEEAAAAAEALRQRQRRRHSELLRPKTARELRNRYLSRIGAQLPPHLGHARLMRNMETPQNTPAAHRQVLPDDDEVIS